MIVRVLRVLRYVVVVLCLVYVVLQDGEQSDAVYGSTDAQLKYGGKGLGAKCGAKLKANFNTPMANKSNKKVTASVNNGGEGVKGEKVKEKVVVGATGGCGAEQSSGEQCVGARRNLTKEKLDNLSHHLGDGRGQCIIISAVVSVCCCCAGVNRCKLCKGRCCSLVNDVMNVLIEYGEIDPNTEVTIIVLLFVSVVVIVFVVE